VAEHDGATAGPAAPGGAREAQLLLDGLSFPEAPRWRDGLLYFSDVYTQRVLTLAPDGTLTTLCEVPGNPAGLGFTPDGELLVISMEDRRLLRLSDGALHEVAALGELAPGPLNDMLVDEQGRAWFGNFGSDLLGGEPIAPTGLLRVDPDGSVHALADDLWLPNAIAILPGRGADGPRTLIVAETLAFRITAFDLAPDGTLSNRRAWADWGPAENVHAGVAAGLVAPDGVCVDAEGAVWVASATTPGIARVREGGEVVERVETGELSVFAATLGGEDGRTLYLCAGPSLGRIDPKVQHQGQLLRCRVDVPGPGF